MVDLFKTNPDFTCNHDMRKCTFVYRKDDNSPEVKVDAFCTDERIKSEDVPAGLLKYDVRSSDYNADQWSTIELQVAVNHCATIVTDTPIELGQHTLNDGSVDKWADVVFFDIDYDEDIDLCKDDEDMTIYEVGTTYKSGKKRTDLITAKNESEMWKIYDKHHDKNKVDWSGILDARPA